MKIEQGTVLTDGKKYWLFGDDNLAHPIEVSTDPEHFDLYIWEEEPTYVIRNRSVIVTKDMKPITDIVELTPSVKLIPKSKAVIVHSVFRQGYYDLEDLQQHYDMRKPYVIDLTNTVSAMVDSYGFTGATEYSALHYDLASDLGCWDYDYATVALYGVVSFIEPRVFYRASSMQLTDMEDYRLVLKEAVGNVGIDNTDCEWVTGSHNVNCSNSKNIFKCTNTSFSYLSNYLVDCKQLNSCKFCEDCRCSSHLIWCINVHYCETCLCCLDHDLGFYSLFNKRVNTEEYCAWEQHIEDSKAKTWADLYMALSYDKIRHLIRRKTATITAEDVSAFRKRIKPYC